MYQPTADYNEAYDAALRRLRAGGARQRGQLVNELASRNVITSGVATEPLLEHDRAQGDQEAGLAGQFALEQAHTGIEDRRAAEAFERNKILATMGYEAQDALQRRMAKSQLTSALIAGGTGAAGSYFSRR